MEQLVRLALLVWTGQLEPLERVDRRVVQRAREQTLSSFLMT